MNLTATVTFDPGQSTSKIIHIPIDRDQNDRAICSITFNHPARRALRGGHAEQCHGGGDRPECAPALSLADAQATEGTDHALLFPVTLYPAASATVTVTVTVDYATADGTATATPPRRAFGAHGTLLRAADTGGFALTADADGLLLRMRSEAAAGRLLATAADVTRWRLLGSTPASLWPWRAPVARPASPPRPATPSRSAPPWAGRSRCNAAIETSRATTRLHRLDVPRKSASSPVPPRSTSSLAVLGVGWCVVIGPPPVAAAAVEVHRADRRHARVARGPERGRLGSGCRGFRILRFVDRRRGRRYVRRTVLHHRGRARAAAAADSRRNASRSGTCVAARCNCLRRCTFTLRLSNASGALIADRRDLQQRPRSDSPRVPAVRSFPGAPTRRR